MKKLLLATATLASAFMSAHAQPKLTEVGLLDDFSTGTNYTSDAATGRGIYWSGTQNEQTITRDSKNKQLLVRVNQHKGWYKSFNCSFGDSNGAAPGGIPYTIDISENGMFSFDVKNNSLKDSVAVRFSCLDLEDRAVTHNPGIPISKYNDNWIYQMQVVVQPGQTVTLKAGTPNSAGTINTGNLVGGEWADYGSNPHRIRTDCDLKHIKGFNFVVLNAAKDADAHASALLDCPIAISNFRVGR